MTGNYQTLLVNISDNVLTITLNRPDKRNALNDLMVKELVEVLDEFNRVPEIAVLMLTGSGPAFCAGADLAYLKSLLDKDLSEHKQDAARLHDMFYRLFTFPKPTIAIVNGPAIGGGCGLVNVCDMAIASNAAVFGYPEVKIGFVPALVSVYLVASIGSRWAKELLLTGRILAAGEALKIGLINGIADDHSELMAKAAGTASILKKNAPSSLHFTKRFCNRIVLDGIADLLGEAADLNAESRLHANFREGILSFLEKREPEWIL